MMAWLFGSKGRGSPDRFVKPEIRHAITKAQENNEDVVFHGACRDCLNRKGNNSGEGMRYCMGCAIAWWSETGENRHVSELKEEPDDRGDY